MCISGMYYYYLVDLERAEKKLQLCYLKKEGNYLQKANIDSEALQFTLLM